MRILIRGAGDLATGIAYRLYKCGFEIIILSSICSGPSVSFAVTCSTSAFPSYTALENAIVRRTDR